jgi:hypothetical protein
MLTPNIPLNLAQRKSKTFITHFGGQIVPFYKSDVVAPEGNPVKLSATADTVEPVVPGSCSTGCVGFLAQKVYDPDAYSELAGYEFLNDTRARIGDPAGVVTGQGYAMISNYSGVVAYGDKLYPAASGKMSASRSGSDMSIATSEGSGTDGDTMIRIRFDLAIV